MATHSKLGDLYGLSKEGILALCWSGVALFLDGLFWRVVLALGRLFKFLGSLLEEFYATARAPPPFQDLPPPVEPIPAPIINVVKPDEQYQRDRPAVGPSWATSKPELERRPMYKQNEEDNVYWAGGLHGSLKPGDIGHEKLHGCYTPSAPPDPNVQVYIPHFQCEIYCHSKWKKFYAVVLGRQPGIYDCWECAKVQVDGFSGQDHKSFPSMAQAEGYFGVQLHCIQNH